MSEIAFRPGLRFGRYPQKPESRLSELEQSTASFFDKLHKRFTRNRFSQAYIVTKVNRYEDSLKAYNEQQLTMTILELRDDLYCKGLTEDLIIKAFAIIRETAGRKLKKRH